MPKAEGLILTDGDNFGHSNHVSNLGQQIGLSRGLEVALKIWGRPEVVDQGFLAMGGHEDHLLYACGDGLCHHVLDTGPIHDRQHFFGDVLGDRQKPGSASSDWKYGGPHRMIGHVMGVQ
jgi:hypothetical protein